MHIKALGQADIKMKNTALSDERGERKRKFEYRKKVSVGTKSITWKLQQK